MNNYWKILIIEKDMVDILGKEEHRKGKKERGF